MYRKIAKPKLPKDSSAKRIQILCTTPNIPETYYNLIELLRICGVDKAKLNLENNDHFACDDKINNPLVGKVGPQCKFSCFCCKKSTPFDLEFPA